MQYQATKHTNRQTHPLEAILEHVRNSPTAYVNRFIHNNNNNIQNTCIEQKNKDNPQGRRQDPMHKTVQNTRDDIINP